MSTRKLATLGLAFAMAVLGAALTLPRQHPQASGYVPAQITVNQAAARQATPVTYTLPELHSTPGECGETNTVTYPDSTDEISFDGFVTTNGYIKVVAVLSDTGRTFTTPAPEGWQVSPIAPYRAEYLTEVVVVPCPVVTEPEDPPATHPAPETEEHHAPNHCRD